MPTAVAALPTPAKLSDFPSLADSSSDSLAGEDFAALLLGQLTTDVSLTALTASDTAATPAAADTSMAATDPALLLASLGLTGNPLTPPPADASVRPLANSSLSAADAALTAAGSATAGGPSPISMSTELPPATGAEAGLPALADSAQAGTPAKLAGFEQNLADAQAGNSEISPQQQLTGAAVTGGQHAAHARSGGESVRVDTPFKEPAWSGELGQKVVWLATQDKQSAQITLNPPQLGPIEISLNVKNDQATAVFASGNAEVREAIEAALPRLREMLADAGVQLGQTNVSAESFRQPTNDKGDGGNGRGGRNGDAQLAAAGLGAGGGEGMAGTIRRGNGLVDTFA